MTEQDIFLAALEIADLAQRTDYLDRTCAGNPKLRRQVETLLAVHQRSGEFLDVPALQQIAAGAALPADHPPIPGAVTSAENPAGDGEIDLSFLQPSTKPGSLGRLGHYEIEEVIGRGGCGIVLKAFDERLERVVAIKVMAPELAATSPARKRFLREARAAAAIRHENVIAIYAVEDQPLPFLVMEYIEGQTLQQKLDQNGPLEVAEVLLIGQQIAQGLEAAHALGLIHRDIKPANVLLEKGRNRIKITDFGLARTADDASVTQSGAVVGTPLYMSPEQALGEKIDPRSDLFSLGSLLYVMCSGRPPFRAPSTMAVLMRVAQEPPRPIQEIIPEVSEWLVAIIAKLHAKRLADRFASAKEVADLLGRCLLELQQKGRVESLAGILPKTQEPGPSDKKLVQNETAAAQKNGVEGPASRPTRPRRHRWAAAAAVLLALLAGLGLTEATGVTNVRGTVIRLFSPEGTLVVEVDDPGISVNIDGEEMVITGTGAKEIRLKPGQYKVLASKDGKVLSQELVTVSRNGRQVLRVSKEAVPAMASKALPKDDDPDRRAAEWVLSLGGKCDIRQQGKDRRVAAAADLPKTPFVLAGFDLWSNPKVTDAGLAVFRECPGLSHFILDGTSVTDAGLLHFKDCKELTQIHLAHTAVTDAGLVHFRGCTRLRQLHLDATRVTNAGLAHFANCKDLEFLNLEKTEVSDAGLAPFKDCKNLRIVQLNFTRLTDAGLVYLKNCGVENLHLFQTSVGDEGLAHLASVKTLKLLVLQNSRVTGAVLAHLKEWPNLIDINLTNQRVDDADLAHLKDGGRLEAINIINDRTTDAGLVHLKHCMNLKRLSLFSPHFTDAGLEHLAALTSLRDLRIDGKKDGITEAGVRRLSAALPKCKITWPGGVIEPTFGQKKK